MKLTGIAIFTFSILSIMGITFIHELNYLDNPYANCKVTDQIHILSKNSQFIIVHRNSGLLEEKHYLELYARHVKFDPCGQATFNAVNVIAIDQKFPKAVKIQGQMINVDVEETTADPTAIQITWK